MKQKGRKSAAQLSIVPPKVEEHPKAPDDLLVEERELWNAIVTPREPTFFDEATLPLLKEYVRLTTQVETMAEQIELFEPDWLLTDDGVKRYKNLAAIRDQAQGRMLALTRAMRLTQQSRYVPDKASLTPKGKAATRKIWAKD